MSKFYQFLAIALFALPSYALAADDLLSLQPDDKVLGSAKAKVTVIEYASLSCPHCAEFHNDILPKIQKEYIDTGKVRLIFRHFPINAPALAGSKMVLCTAKLGDEVYNNTLHTLFAKQKDWAFEKEFEPKLMDISKELGLDERAISACLADSQLEAKIIRTRKDAVDKLGVSSTPSFFINGTKTEHLHGIEDFRPLLDKALAAAK